LKVTIDPATSFHIAKMRTDLQKGYSFLIIDVNPLLKLGNQQPSLKNPYGPKGLYVAVPHCAL